MAAQTVPLSLLIVEDNPNDADLVVRELRRSGFAPRVRRVQNQAEFESALDAGYAPGEPWDVILADYALPDFSGLRAVQLLRGRGSDIPFIVVSGTIGEDTAVEVMQAGAIDYLLKDRLTRLATSVRRAIEQRRLREEKRLAEEKYSRLFENSLAGIYETTPDGRLVTANPALARMLGFDSPADLLASLADVARQSYVDPGQRAEFVRRMAEHGAIAGFEFELYRKDGSTIWVSENARAVRDAQGTLLYYDGILEDITARKRSDEALRVSEERYRIVSELASDFAYAARVEPTGELVPEWITEAFTRVTGFTLAEVDLAGGWPSILHPDDVPVFQKRMQTLLSRQSDVSDYRTLTKSGGIRWLRDSGRPVWDDAEQRVVRIYGAARDITERKQATEALGEERNLLRTLIDNLPDAIYVKDRQSRFVIKNLADARKMGAATPEATIGKSDFDFYPAELAAQYYADDQAVIQSGRAIINREEPITEASGRTGWISTTKVPLRDREGNVIGLVGIGHDVTERKQAEQQLQRRAEQLALLYEAGLALSSALDSRTQLETVFGATTKTLHAGRADFFRYDALQNELRLDVTYRYPDESVPPALRNLRFPLGQEKGLVGWVGHERQALYLPDVTLDPRWISFDPVVRSALWVPVQREQQLLGVLCLLGSQTNAFSEVDQRLLELVASQVASALENARLFEETRRRLAELEAVNQVSKALRTAQTVDEMLPVWLDVTLAVMRASGGSIWLYDAAKEELRPAVTRGWPAPAGADWVRPQKLDEGVNGHVFVTGQPYISKNFRVDPHCAESTRDRLPPGGGVGIPIRIEDQVIGTFTVNAPLGREITADDFHLLTTLAEIAGTAMQRTRLFQQTKQRLSQLSALRAIDQAITASMDLDLTLGIFLDHVITQLSVDAADVLLLNPQDQMLSYAAGRGFRSRAFTQARTRVGEGRAGRAVLERQIVISDARLGDEHLPSKRTGLLGGENFVSYVGVPLIAKGQVLGALEVFHRSPLNPSPDWLEFLSALAGQAAIALDNAALFNNLQRSNTGLQRAYDATIEGWARALDLRDHETEGHSRRVTMLTEQLAVAMGVPDEQLVHVRRGALLHDIGKMGVPDYILLKPGPLSDDEWMIMRQHPVYAYEMLSPIEYLRRALDIPYCHHEKWDGSGYPRGLMGEQIPLAVRLFSVVDVWDALCSDRPYRRAWPADRVREYIGAQSGRHFDPAVVAAFMAMDLSDLDPKGFNDLDPKGFREANP